MLELWKGDTKKEKPVTSSGSYTFKGLEDGIYDLKIRFLGQSTYEATYSVPIDKNKTADPISATAVGGVSKITATVTSASAKDITVTVLKGTKSIETRTITSGVGSVEIKDIPNGTYTVQFAYTESTGVDPIKIDNVIVTDTSTAIKFTSVVAGEEKLTVSGQAAAGAPVIVSLTPGGYDTTVTPGTDGLFSVVIPCAAGTYTAVHAQYQGNPGSKVDMAGSWTVTGSSVKPELSIDPVFDDELIVMASTKPGITVRLDAYDYSQTLVSSADGTLKFTLYHTYAAGTNLSFTVYYGNLNQYSYTTTKTVTAASVYRTLTIGDSGTDVYDLTKRLFGLDYPISAQNVYDAGVANVVQLFQQRNGLPANGIADPTTQKVAFSSSAIPYDSHYIVPLVRGDRGPLVSALQSRLKELGYYTIRVDGIFGSGTQRAVRNFQARNGLSVTGIADVTTQNVLYSSSAIPSGGSVPSTYTTLKRSSRYQAGVVPLQSRLNALGYAAGSADGYFGSRTYRAVRNFQARNGLSVTGIADPTTQQVLYSSSAIPAGGSSVVPVPSGNVYRLLYWGCKGDDVRRLQQALKNLGYSQIKYVDGIYGKQTYDAVRAFQKNNGLSVDGIAGRKTQNRLYGTNY
ncbi:MAG: peptidoglycan-binding protein [Clostridia bacterium]|nr:peptidoglycan-binding protein [Clostridia bacterium]